MKIEIKKHTGDIFQDIREILKNNLHSLILVPQEVRNMVERRYGQPREIWNLNHGFCEIRNGIEGFYDVQNETIQGVIGLTHITQNLYSVAIYYDIRAQDGYKQLTLYSNRTEQVVYLE